MIYSDIIFDLLGGSIELNRIFLWWSSSSSNLGSNFMVVIVGFYDFGVNNIEVDYDLWYVVDVVIVMIEIVSCYWF